MQDWEDVDPRTSGNEENVLVLEQALEYHEPGVEIDSVTHPQPYSGQTKSELIA
jgi:phage baseplate assembly protein W